MNSIDQLVCQAINPFDPATFKPGNFWYEQPDLELEVDSIHQDAVDQASEMVTQVVADHQTRTLLLMGDSGSGKSYLLGRIKRQLNDQASFVYIDPFPDSQAIWRHILRYTVDGLIQAPIVSGEAASTKAKSKSKSRKKPQSQLLRWLKQLAVLDSKDVGKWGKIKRQRVIQKLKDAYPTGIYNPSEFFGALYDLLDPSRYTTACEWLRGDDIDQESLETLQVKEAIVTEDAAQKILANFGRIAADTQPIILCFDQLDNIARNAEGQIDLQSLFGVNSTIHNQGLKNFLVIISIITSTWRQQSQLIQTADRARIDQTVSLRRISLDQAEALWAYRLAPLHAEADPAPESAIAPFSRRALDRKFPGGKTHPRNVLELGRRQFQAVKTGVADKLGLDGTGVPSEAKTPSTGTQSSGPMLAQSKEDRVAAFRLLWRKELAQTQERITRLRQLAAPDLILMLQEMLEVIKIEDVRSRLIPSQTYTSHSLSYKARPTDNLPSHARIGVVWNDDPNMTTFYHVMNACWRVTSIGLCHTLYLIRSSHTGKRGRKSNALFNEIFDGKPHQRIRVDLLSVQYLATYHRLVNAAHGQELMVAGAIIGLEGLESLMRKARIPRNCRLLQDLGLVWGRERRSHSASEDASSQEDEPNPVRLSKELEPIKEFLLDLIKTHRILGVSTLIDTAAMEFPQVPPDQWQKLVTDLCKGKQVKLLDPKAKLDAQLIAFSD
ncbi:MAG: AAA family ATPase [Cyanobacteria bacterium P01_F01_bin.150]